VTSWSDRIREVAESFDVEGPMDFICECSREDCTEKVALAADEYNGVRSSPTTASAPTTNAGAASTSTPSDYMGIHIDRDLYIVLRDHPTIDGENVVEREDGYDIVSKAAA
jgi:hypothetical protein